MSNTPPHQNTQLITSNFQFSIRPGTPEDVPLLRLFIDEMAEFEKLTLHANEDELREAFFGATPFAHTFLAFDEQKPIAYIVYLFNFSTMLGKRGLWLEDIYVRPEYRGKGVGKALMQFLQTFAAENKCARFEWMVLDWNENAISFYKSLGAQMLDDWRVCRITI
jgi:hypothetical protein